MKKIIFLAAVLICTLSIETFAQQPDITLVPYRNGNKWGYATPGKEIVIQPAYEDAGWFFGGYAAVKKGGKYGYINRQGKVVIPFKFFTAKPFRYGYVDNKAKGKADTVLFAGASPKNDGFEVCINTKGVRLMVCPAINENTDPVNRQPIETKEKVYTLNSPTGLFDKITDDYSVEENPDNFYIAQKNGMYGVFNNKFEVLIPFEYNSLTKFSVGNQVYLQGKKNNGLNGIFKGDGSAVMPAEYSIMRHVIQSNGSDYFIIVKDGKAVVRSLDNQDLFPSTYT